MIKSNTTQRAVKVSNLKIAKLYYLIGQNMISNLYEVAVYVLDTFMRG